ncbi:MAG: LysM domain-containing protein, partial [Bacillota bacterium]|nr:LysM domain-containing protein [Bacillota bacterium]
AARTRRPPRSASAKSPAAAPSPAPPAIPALTVKYVVQPGDTLHRIARRFGTTARTLALLNELHKPVLLVPGEIILVPDEGRV